MAEWHPPTQRTTLLLTRALLLQVLPPLLGELRDVTLQPTLVPIVLSIVQQQDPTEFVDSTLPALK